MSWLRGGGGGGSGDPFPGLRAEPIKEFINTQVKKNLVLLTDTATSHRSSRAVVIVGLSIGTSILGAVLILLGGTVGGIVVFGSGSGVKAAALRVDAGVSALQVKG